MPKFNPKIESKSIDELVIIANSTIEEWQSKAILDAQDELLKRNISNSKQQELLKEIGKRIIAENLNELEKRRIEDYPIFEMIFIILR